MRDTPTHGRVITLGGADHLLCKCEERRFAHVWHQPLRTHSPLLTAPAFQRRRHGFRRPSAPAPPPHDKTMSRVLAKGSPCTDAAPSRHRHTALARAPAPPAYTLGAPQNSLHNATSPTHTNRRAEHGPDCPAHTPSGRGRYVSAPHHALIVASHAPRIDTDNDIEGSVAHLGSAPHLHPARSTQPDCAPHPRPAPLPTRPASCTDSDSAPRRPADSDCSPHPHPAPTPNRFTSCSTRQHPSSRTGACISPTCLLSSPTGLAPRPLPPLPRLHPACLPPSRSRDTFEDRGT
ncbi:hypothetical protein DFH08DRAFT_1087723 [Mycena albidolilacea]|uniref:Uncharacterized protein n=1 Tax=Mycena albidolilacea TaxID=1033008 RepID=A0AAD7ED17_9AGAR|nr:hypothetical protein DFH08DRAFT_1087723 [Mycena albidolilacea]